jgi:hypothetical protein
MSRGISEWIDYLQLFDDRAGPAVRDDDRQRILMFRTNVNEMNSSSAISRRTPNLSTCRTRLPAGPCLNLRWLHVALESADDIDLTPSMSSSRRCLAMATQANQPRPVGGDDRIARAWVTLMKRLGYTKFVAQGGVPSGISMTTTWVPWYDILLFFLRVGLTKIWELGTDPIAIRGSAVPEGPV